MACAQQHLASGANVLAAAAGDSAGARTTEATMRCFGFARSHGGSDTAPKKHVPVMLTLVGSVVALNVASAFASLAMLP